MGDRPRWHVNEDSRSFRRYETWRKRKGMASQQLNLCHYFWVLVLWGPLRWFWQARLFTWRGGAAVTPAMIFWPAFLSCLLAYLIVAYPSIMWTVFLWTLFGCLLAVLISAIIWGIIALIKRDPRAAEDLFWRCARPFERFGRWFYRMALTPTGHFLVRPFLRVRGFPITPLLPLGLALIVLWFVADWKAALIGLGITVGVLLVCVLVALVVLHFEEQNDDWKEDRDKALDLGIEPPPKPQHLTGLKTFWQFLVATKHQLCPLIDVKPGGDRAKAR